MYINYYKTKLLGDKTNPGIFVTCEFNIISSCLLYNSYYLQEVIFWDYSIDEFFNYNLKRGITREEASKVLKKLFKL